MKVKKRVRKIGSSYVGSNKNSPILWRRKMNIFIPLSSLKDTIGIVELCNKVGELVVVNRNGEIKIVIMTKDIFNEYFRIRKPNGELDISYNTVATAVKKLVELGILQETTNATRNRVFAYEAYLWILRKDT